MALAAVLVLDGQVLVVGLAVVLAEVGPGWAAIVVVEFAPVLPISEVESVG